MPAGNHEFVVAEISLFFIRKIFKCCSLVAVCNSIFVNWQLNWNWVAHPQATCFQSETQTLKTFQWSQRHQIPRNLFKFSFWVFYHTDGTISEMLTSHFTLYTISKIFLDRIVSYFTLDFSLILKQPVFNMHSVANYCDLLNIICQLAL